MRSLASMVRYGGRLSLHFKILSMVFFLFSPVNGGWGRITVVTQTVPFREGGCVLQFTAIWGYGNKCLQASCCLSFISLYL